MKNKVEVNEYPIEVIEYFENLAKEEEEMKMLDEIAEKDMVRLEQEQKDWEEFLEATQRDYEKMEREEKERLEYFEECAKHFEETEQINTGFNPI